MGKIAILGSGLIGRCWAMLFSRAGHQVVLYDVVKEQLDAALVSIAEQLGGLEKSGLLNGQASAEVSARVSITTDLKDAMTGAIYLQECVPEILDLKIKVFKQLDEVAEAVGNSSIILASSTSCIAPSQFTENLKLRSRCIVSHPVNPPHYIPVVEVVPAPWTDASVVSSTRAILEEIGQAPVVLKREVDGFVINRLQYALLMEAYRLVEDGVCSPEDVDTAVSQGLGLRWSFMGPFETIDLNAPKGVVDYCERYAEGIQRVCLTQTDMRLFKGSTVTAIDEAMRKKYSVDGLDSRRQWRDGRLAALTVHKLMEKKKDDGCSK